MEDISESIKKLVSDYPFLSIEKTEKKILVDLREERIFSLRVKGLKGAPDIAVSVRDNEDLDRIRRIAASECVIFRSLLGYRKKEDAVVLVRADMGPSYFMSNEEVPLLEASLSYGKSKIDIRVAPSEDQELITDVSRVANRGRSWMYRRAFVVKVCGLNSQASIKGDFEKDIEAILNSVFYDLDLTYGFSLTPFRVEARRPQTTRRIKFRSQRPNQKIDLVYKNHIPELLQYYRQAKRTDYGPFQFLCYFHILEFHADKSAFRVAHDAIKKMVSKHDFHANSAVYIRDCIKLLRKETDKHNSDKIKLQRVLQQFIVMDDLVAFLTDWDLLEHFQKEGVLECASPLKLKALSIENESKFFDTLTSRIYALRCSIVHSNPDFDESKAIPFVASPSNLEKLEPEIELAAEIARSVISGSAVESS